MILKPSKSSLNRLGNKIMHLSTLTLVQAESSIRMKFMMNYTPTDDHISTENKASYV